MKDEPEERNLKQNSVPTNLPSEVIALSSKDKGELVLAATVSDVHLCKVIKLAKHVP